MAEHPQSARQCSPRASSRQAGARRHEPALTRGLDRGIIEPTTQDSRVWWMGEDAGSRRGVSHRHTAIEMQLVSAASCSTMIGHTYAAMTAQTLDAGCRCCLFCCKPSSSPAKACPRSFFARHARARRSPASPSWKLSKTRPLVSSFYDADRLAAATPKRGDK